MQVYGLVGQTEKGISPEAHYTVQYNTTTIDHTFKLF